MLQFVDGEICYCYELCQQCGACCAVCPRGAISLVPLENGLKRIKIDSNLCIRCQKCVGVCPANRKYNIIEDHDDYLDSIAEKKFFLAWNSDDKIRHLSSSGGATKTIIIESLKSGFVDGVYSLRKWNVFPSAIGEFYTKENIPSFDDLPNSVYHSIMACTEISKVQKVHRLMIVGTSCQLYALEKSLKGKYDELVRVCIFCKQQKTLDSTKWLAKISGSKISSKGGFTAEYRGGGWPGFVRINGKPIAWEQAAGLPFGRRLWTVPGCNICADPFGLGVGADISVMDPWKIRLENKLGETLVAVHSETGLQLMQKTESLIVEKKTFAQVVDALGLDDVRRKRTCASYFLGNEVSKRSKQAAIADVKQRLLLEKILTMLPRLPLIFFRMINKIIPKKRDSILQYKDSI